MTDVALRRVFRIVNGGTPTADDENWDGPVPWATPVDLAKVNGGVLDATARTLTHRGLVTGSAQVPAGSLILSTRAPIGYVAEVRQTTAFNQGCRGLVPRIEIDPRFFRYQLSVMAGRLHGMGSGSTFVELSTEALANTRIAVSTVERQRAIADFLDVETARIDALLRARERMLGALDERAVSLAHEAITGTEMSGQRVPAPEAWLGDIPAVWDVKSVGSQFEVRLGRMLTAERATTGDLRPYVRNINVRWDHVDVTDLALMDFPSPERVTYRLRVDDLLINEGGAGIGRAALWAGQADECYFQKSVLRLRPHEDANPRWMLECMRVAVDRKVLLVNSNLATIPHVPAEALRRYRLPFPARQVQDELLARLDLRRAKDSALRSCLTAQMALLREHRRALITAAVTGEIDVSKKAS